jgi:hypothetical protein
MFPRDFCYWLQSCFEIRQLKALTAEQTKEVANHLAIVMGTKADRNLPHMQCGLSFCQRLAGTFDAIELANGLSEAQVSKIKTNLSAAFRDEIDPTFSNEPELNAIHTGSATPSQSTLIDEGPVLRPRPDPERVERC